MGGGGRAVVGGMGTIENIFKIDFHKSMCRTGISGFSIRRATDCVTRSG